MLYIIHRFGYKFNCKRLICIHSGPLRDISDCVGARVLCSGISADAEVI